MANSARHRASQFGTDLIVEPAIIQAQGISLSRGASTILRSIDLELEQGGFFAVVGPSGAGKTSLLRCINGLIANYEGTMLLRGEDTRALDPIMLKRSIGYVLQGIGLFPHMTIGENIALPARIASGSSGAHDENLNRLLAMMELPADIVERMPSQLSGGQAQRVAIARALFAKPEIMLMDEPFGALDPAVRSSLGRAYRHLHDETGLTTVMVTHDVSEALSLADRVVVLDEGALIAFDTPSGLMRGQTVPGAEGVVASLIGPPVQQAEDLLTLRDRS